jgi:hypothetical protein
MVKRLLCMESHKELCKGMETELTNYMPFEQIVIFFYSKDLNQLYNVVYSEDDDVRANFLNLIKLGNEKIRKMKENIVKVGQPAID